ncbi:MAG: PDZ domain-containing protein [Myxococcales bacterium]|nr:PDZ domain-containing protein [Myxococcales bacterium]
MPGAEPGLAAAGEGDDAGGETPPIDVGDSIECSGGTCLIDRHWAQSLWSNPEPLLTDAARLVYDSQQHRFVCTTVEPGDVAHALGLRSGDVLLTINGLAIDGPEAGLLAYVENEQTEVVDLTVLRDGREHTLRFEFVGP